MRIAVLDLIALPASVAQQIRWDRSLARVPSESLRMGDRDRVRSRRSQHDQVVGRGRTAARRVLHYGLVGQRLAHGPVAYGERLLPHAVARDVSPAFAFVQTDDITGEV